VLTYNSKLEKIYATLNSVIGQESLEKIEIIIADDGSKRNFFEEISCFLEIKGVNNYKLIANEKNKGTVENFYSGVKVAKGRYIKALGCGDLLYKKDTINRFCTFMEETDKKIAFGLLKSFEVIDSDINYWDCTIPMDIRVFRENNLKRVNRNIISWGKLISGASIIFEIHTLIRLLDEIRGKVVYCEDFVQIIALVNNIRIEFLNEYIVWYEMGEGISTSNNSTWKERIKKDYDSLFIYLEKKYKDNPYILRRVKKQHLGGYPKLFRGGVKFLMDPGMFFISIKTKFQKRQGLYVGEDQYGFLNDINTVNYKE
jgi:GT2 family glycosyltransferase